MKYVIRDHNVYRHVAAGLIIGSLLLGLGHLTRGHDWGGDFAQYIMQAQSIVEGTVPAFLDANRITIEHSYRPIGPVAYPWGLPLILAPLVAWFGINLTLFKLVGVISFVLFLILYAFYLRRYHTTLACLLLLAAFALNPALLGSQNQIASDLPFMMVSTAVILMLSSRSPSSWLRGVAIGLLIGMACLLRSNGILLLIPLAVSQCGRWIESRHKAGEKTKLMASIVTFAHVTPWLAFAALYGTVTWLLPGGGSSHLGHFQSVTGQTILHNIIYYIKLPLAFYEGVPGRWGICLLTYPLALIGVLSRLRRDYPVILYLLATLGLYILWPDSMQGLRFLFPLLPFYLSFVVSGFQVLVRRGSPAISRIAQGMGVGLAVYVVAAMGITSARSALVNHQQDRIAPEGPYTERSQQIFDLVRSKTAMDDIIIFDKPRVMFWLTGRKAFASQAAPEDLPPGTIILFDQDREKEPGYSIRTGMDLAHASGNVVWIHQQGTIWMGKIQPGHEN